MVADSVLMSAEETACEAIDEALSKTKEAYPFLRKNCTDIVEKRTCTL